MSETTLPPAGLTTRRAIREWERELERAGELDPRDIQGELAQIEAALWPTRRERREGSAGRPMASVPDSTYRVAVSRGLRKQVRFGRRPEYVGRHAADADQRRAKAPADVPIEAVAPPEPEPHQPAEPLGTPDFIPSMPPADPVSTRPVASSAPPTETAHAPAEPLALWPDPTLFRSQHPRGVAELPTAPVPAPAAYLPPPPAAVSEPAPARIDVLVDGPDDPFVTPSPEPIEAPEHRQPNMPTPLADRRVGRHEAPHEPTALEGVLGWAAGTTGRRVLAGLGVLLGFVVLQLGMWSVVTGQLTRVVGWISVAAGGYLVDRAWRGLLRPVDAVVRSQAPPLTLGERLRWAVVHVPWIPLVAVAVGWLLAKLRGAA